VIAVDTSALLAIALKEAERDEFTRIIGANRCIIGTTTVLESHMTLRKRIGAEWMEFLESLLTRRHVTVVPFDAALLPIARLAFDRYGRGRHRARLNFGDCMAYAVAKANDVPLLFKGNDFGLTDIRPAMP
jgi:ribonuclease VapC